MTRKQQTIMTIILVKLEQENRYLCDLTPEEVDAEVVEAIAYLRAYKEESRE